MVNELGLSALVRIHHAQYTADLPFWIEQTAGLSPILEVGCGPGRVTLPLAEAGRELVGVDHDQAALSYLQQRLRESREAIQERITVIDSDILAYQPGYQFGGVIIPCNTYLTFPPPERRRLLELGHACLRSEGKLIISLPNPQTMLAIHATLIEQKEIESPDLEALITHPKTGFPVQVSSRVRPAPMSLFWDWIYDHLLPDGQVQREIVTVEHFPSSIAELITELNQSGYHKIQLQGDFTGAEYGDDSPFLILICHK